MLQKCHLSLVGIVLPVVVTSCAHDRTGSAVAPPGMVRLRIECCIEGEVYDAKTNLWQTSCGRRLEFAHVLIDGKEAGSCHEWGGGKHIRPGFHHIKVQHLEDGCCFDSDEDVELAPGGNVAVKATLGKFPD